MFYKNTLVSFLVLVLSLNACNSSSPLPAKVNTNMDIGVAINSESRQGELTFMSFYARATTDVMSAGYGIIMNNGNKTIVLTETKITDGREGIAEIHQTTINEGIASMKKMSMLTIPPKTMVTLAPGGIHIMIMDLNKPLNEGDSLGISLFDNTKTEYKIKLDIQKIGTAMDHSNMDMGNKKKN
jgi:periplasmic copper chaperone A|tara:strand:+ start:259 stop:810 length:552 start_codon:yes stop_codon:yes gene_type:complete